MCATPCPKHQAVLAVLAADVAALVAVNPVSMALVKAIPSAPMPGAVDGPHVSGKKGKVIEESVPATLDESTVC
jgi:hypothetical protein